MDPVQSTLIVFAVLLLCLASGLWVFLALILTSGLSLFLVMDFDPARIGSIANLIIVRSATSWELAAVPMFIWMGEIMFRTDISDRLFRGLAPIVQRLPGGLLHVNVIGSALFAAVTGSSTATTATVGKVTLTELARRKYSDRLAIGSLTGSGSLGLLIPPSIALIIYGVLAEVSIAKLFIAGIVPGVLIAFAYSAYIAGRCLITPALAPQEAEEADESSLGAIVKNISPVFGLIFVVLGSIYTGWATPSEAAAIGVFVAMIFAVTTRQMTFEIFRQTIINALKTSCMVCAILMSAAFLSTAIGYMHVPRNIALFIESLELSPYVLIIALSLFYILLGLFLDGISIIVMSLPITLPIVLQAGFDPIWYGIFLIIMIELGLMTPPVGLNLFVMQSISRKPIYRVAAYAAPFFLLMCLVVVLITVWPELVLWLTRIL